MPGSGANFVKKISISLAPQAKKIFSHDVYSLSFLIHFSFLIKKYVTSVPKYKGFFPIPKRGFLLRLFFSEPNLSLIKGGGGY